MKGLKPRKYYRAKQIKVTLLYKKHYLIGISGNFIFLWFGSQ